MRNTWKKTAAFLLAFTLAAVPLSQTGVKGGLFGKVGIVANAAETKEIGLNVEYAIGDSIRLPADLWILIDDEDDGEPDIYKITAGDYVVPDNVAYLGDYNQFNFDGLLGYDAYITPPNGGSTDKNDVAGIKVVSGDGSYDDPYKFAIVYKNTSPKISNASVTINDGFGLNFYVDDITDATGYTVEFAGACDENGTKVALTEKDGKFFAAANVNAKDFKENITATLYKDDVATDVTFTSSVNAYLTAALASGTLDDKTKAMVTSAQLYGLAADEYFNETNNNVAARIAAYMTAANINDTALNMALTPYTPSFTSDDAKVSMVLNSKIKLRVYSDNGTNENGFGKYSEVAGLTPLTLAQPQAIDGFTVSGYTWVYRVLNNTASEAKDVNMAKALFAYMSAAQKLAVVDVASVTITNAPTAAITVGNTSTLTATVAPDNATNKTVTWAVTEGADVLSINAATGAYTALSAGTATITATAGGKSATCAITVNAPQPKTLTVDSFTFNYIEGQKWGEITLPAGVYRSGPYICYDEYDPSLDETWVFDLFDETTDDWVNTNDVIDSTHSYRWY